MKKQILIIISILFCFAFIFTGCKDNSNPKEDISSTETEISLQGTQAEFKDFEKISNISYSICVPNETQTFNFSNYVKTAETSQWVLSKDSTVMQTVPNKIVNLEIGDNYFYVLVSASDNTDKLYTLKVRRRPTYTVSYYFYYSKIDELTVEENEKITEPSIIPEKIGYEFLGWDFDFNVPITSNISINAKYNKIKYTINYHNNGGTINENTNYSKSFYIDTLVDNFPIPSKQGYSFIGWYDNPGYEGKQITSISGYSYAKNVDLYARYQLNSYQVVDNASRLVEIFNDPLATQISITLNNDIDLKGIDLLSIGSANKGYRATFDGNGYSIKNYTGKNGLFAYTSGATIKNLKIENANLTNSNINQNSFSGILIGYALNTLVENCSVNGKINIISSANVWIGGICGYADSLAIRNCLSNVNIDYKFRTNSDWIDSTYVCVGNLIGSCYSLSKFSDELSPKLTKCKSSGEIKIDNEYATMEVGGLIGKIFSPSNAFINSCCSDVVMKVNGNTLCVGGLLGNGNIYTMNCYALGNINATNTSDGKNYIGGVIAYNENSITNCYSDLDISIETFPFAKETYVGGIVGYNNISNASVVEGCYSVGNINAYSHNEETIVVIGSIYGYSNSIDKMLYNLELDNQQLIANKGQILGEVIESNIKYSFEEILNIVHTTLQYPWNDSIWNFYNDKNPTLKFEND